MDAKWFPAIDDYDDVVSWNIIQIYILKNPKQKRKYNSKHLTDTKNFYSKHKAINIFHLIYIVMLLLSIQGQLFTSSYFC